MYRFFTQREQIIDGKVHITGDDVNHIRNVLRMKKGETILISCGDEWEYTCRISELSEDEILADVTDAQKPGKELRSKIYLFQCLPKSDKMETVIQKAVELGAFAVVPVSSKRCIVKLDQKRAKQKVVRWNGIAESAAKQAKRMIIPAVHEITNFREALEMAKELDVKLIPYEMESGMNRTRELFASIEPGQSVAVLIGPEGGFDEAEVELAKEAGFSSITLGRRILRTETAGMTTLSILMYLLEQD
uniref:16S rRNA (uracil(1498)-N(3))-methyltransferase n=1 Tax=Eubacterium cellulosolvens TaxID=29322 RepID=UPI0004891FDA|nr:16S rRNA (uracil(1498)-N(3))-methyltransferase [[Eubacterium] cellulosolvens]